MKPKPKPDLHIFKTETTKYWREDIVAKAGRLYALYLIDVNRHVNCCELIPSYELHYVGSTYDNFVGDEVVDQIRQGDVDGFQVAYYHVKSLDIKKLERLPTISDQAWEELIQYHDGDEQGAYDEVVEKKLERLRCNGYIH